MAMPVRSVGKFHFSVAEFEGGTSFLYISDVALSDTGVLDILSRLIFEVMGSA